MRSHFSLENFSSGNKFSTTDFQLIFLNEIQRTKTTIGNLQEFVDLTRLTNSPVLQALGNSIWHEIMPTLQLCREYEEMMLRQNITGYLRLIFRLKSQLQYVNELFNFLRSYCQTIQTEKKFSVSHSIQFLNFLFNYLTEIVLAHGRDDYLSQMFMKIFSDCLVPVSRVVDNLLSRTLSCQSPFIRPSCKNCYSLKDLKLFDAISPQLESVLNEYVTLNAMFEPPTLELKVKSLHALFTEAIVADHTSFQGQAFVYRWNELITTEWATTTLLEFQQKNTHAILETCNVLEILDNLHRSILGTYGENSSLEDNASWEKLLQRLNQSHLLGTYSYETFEKMLQFSKLTNTTAYTLRRIPRKLLTRLEMRTIFEMQHFLNILLNCIQKGQLLWFRQTREKLQAACNLNQFRDILNQHNNVCASYLFCRQHEKPIYDAITIALEQIAKFVKYFQQRSLERKTKRDVQRVFGTAQEYQKSCNMLHTILSFKRNESDIDPLLQDNIRQVLIQYNYNDFYR